MRGWLRLAVVALACHWLAACVSGEGASAPADNGAWSAPSSAPDRRLATGDGRWELRIWYRAKGTRSEGQHGALYANGREVPTPEDGAERETGLGRMRYFGMARDRLPWQPTGWNFADAAHRLPPSWQDSP